MTTFAERDAKRREQFDQKMTFIELLNLETQLLQFRKDCRQAGKSFDELDEIFTPVLEELEAAEIAIEKVEEEAEK